MFVCVCVCCVYSVVGAPREEAIREQESEKVTTKDRTVCVCMFVVVVVLWEVSTTGIHKHQTRIKLVEA